MQPTTLFRKYVTSKFTKKKDRDTAIKLAAQNVGNAVIHELANSRELRRYLQMKHGRLSNTIESQVNIINFVTDPPKKVSKFKKMINRMRGVFGKGIEIVQDK